MKKDKLTPFNDKFGDSIGRGKDNVVVPLVNKNDLVIKWNHDPKQIINNEDHFQRILYKKKKYEMLKFFLSEFIPESFFILGEKLDSGVKKTKEYTIQKRVPQKTINSLSEKQKQDPRLLRNIHILIQKLQNMYRMIHQINNVVDDDAKIDAKLDLGGLSKFAEENSAESFNDFNWDIINRDFMNSPNLLVNPETMQIYCVDFDQGVWNYEKDATLILLKALSQNNNEVMKIINK